MKTAPTPRRPRSKLAPNSGTAASSIATQFYNSPDWCYLRAAIMTALQDFPQARQTVISALLALHAIENPNGPAS